MTVVTHRQIALRAGVHQSTISRALSGDPRLPAATAQRVRALAEEMGYRPNPLLAQVAAQRWRDRRAAEPVVAMIFQDRAWETAPGDPARHFRGACARAAQLGYRVEPFFRGDYSSGKSLGEVLWARGIRGVIVDRLFQPATEGLDWSRFVAVSAGAGTYDPGLDSIQYDPLEAMLLAGRKARAFGYRRPAFLLYRHDSGLLDDELRAVAVELIRDRYFPGMALPVRWGDARNPYPPDLAPWLKESDPDVLIGFNGVYLVKVRELGWAVPQRLAYIDLHVEPGDANLAGVLSGGFFVGYTLMDILHRNLLAQAWGCPGYRLRHLLEPRWSDGPTLPQRDPSGPSGLSADAPDRGECHPGGSPPQRRAAPTPGKTRGPPGPTGRDRVRTDAPRPASGPPAQPDRPGERARARASRGSNCRN